MELLKTNITISAKLQTFYMYICIMTQAVPRSKHFVSAIKASPLMLCK